MRNSFTLNFQKRILIAFLFFFASLPLLAQELDPACGICFSRDVEAKIPIESCQYAVNYHFTIQYEFEDSMRIAVDTLVLEVGETHNKFTSVTSEREDSATFYRSRDGVRSDYGDALRLYMDVYTDKIKQERRVFHHFGVNDYFYKEKVTPLQWEILEEKETILGYNCQKARTEYGGRTWYAWYTVDVPLNYGPWKLNGLPGLILKAEDADAIFTWKAIGVEEPKNRTIYQYTSEDYKKILDNEHNRYQEREVSRKAMDKLCKRRWLAFDVMLTVESRGQATIMKDGVSVAENKIIPDGFYPQFEIEFDKK